MKFKDYLLLGDEALKEIDTSSVGCLGGDSLAGNPFKKKKKKRLPKHNANAWLNPINVAEEKKYKYYKANIKFNNLTICSDAVVVASCPDEVAEYWTDIAVNKLLKNTLTKKQFKEYYESHPGEFEIEEINWNDEKEAADRLLIKEGGNAVQGVVRLNVANVRATLQSVFKNALPALGVKESDVRVLGSAGKKSTGSHGDLDIGVSLQALIKNNNLASADDVWEFLEGTLSRMSSEVKAMRGIGTCSCAWPIVSTDGLQDGQFVQVDFMIADSIDWLEFKNFSPTDVESHFKGAHRNLLLVAIAKYASYQVRKENDGTPVEWEKWTIQVNGLARNIETNLGKNGKIVKSKRVIDQTILTTDPKKAVEMILGPGYTVQDCNSFESLYKIVTSPNFRLKEFKTQILQDAARGIHGINLPVPSQLEGYL